MPRLLLAFLLMVSLLATLMAQQPKGPLGAESAAALYEKGMNALMGTGISHHDVQALDYIRRSAQAGYGPAQVALGYFEETGSLTAREPQEAAQDYRKAALHGDRLAQWVLGRLYYTGDAAPIRDLNEAEKWLKQAASQGDPFGAHVLGVVRLERQDYPSAAKWFRAAAEQGLPQAQQQLGLLLKDGRGVPADKFEAYVWLLLSLEEGGRGEHRETAARTAAVGGAPADIGDVLNRLEADLGTAQTEQAKSRVRELQASVSRAVTAHGCTGWPGEFDAIPATPPPDLHKFCR
jgi:hypothetical protein